MKMLLKLLLAVVSALIMFSSCNRAQVIPDDALRSIIKDIYLSNAYVSSYHISMDTIDLYRPIFDKYGYDIDDFKYTIDNFSRRKSSRLSDVVNDVIDQLESDYEIYQGRVAVFDTIDARASRTFARVIYGDSLIRVRRAKDTTALRIKIPVTAGMYEVGYNYFSDSLEKNRSLRTTLILFDTSGKSKIVSTQWLRPAQKLNHQAKITTTDEHNELEILLANYPKKMLRAHTTFDSLEVKYFLPRDAARDSLLRYLLNYKFVVDGQEFSTLPKDSITLAIDPPWAAPQPDSLR